MSGLRALGPSVRGFISTSRSLGPATEATTRRGDPGPQASRFRKSQRKVIREGRNVQALAGLADLDRVLETTELPATRRDRSPRPSTTLPGGRFPRKQGIPPTASDAYGTSLRLRKIVQPRSGSMTTADFDKAIKLVFDSPRSAVSVPVWNMLLGTIGREGRLELMWKTFNDMKKRGFKPNSRTFTTLINAYAGLRHSGDTSETRKSRLVEPKTASRVAIIYDQAQAYLRAKEAELQEAESRNDPDELGLGTDAVLDDEGTVSVDSDVNVGPTNAYLKFLARYGLFAEMDKVFLAMPTTGPLAPDVITYTTMFSALYDSLNRSTDRGSSAKQGLRSTAGGLWIQMTRQFRSANAGSDRRTIDESVALIALKCMTRGDQTTQRQAMEIVDALWALPRPSSSAPPMLRGADRTSGPTLPRLPLSIRAATTIMSICPKPTDRSHYAHMFMHRPELKDEIDTPFLIAAIRALSETGDIETVREILDNYQPRQPNQWPISVWHDALTAARWSTSEEQGFKSQPDFDAALAVLRRMTHLSPGIEDGQPASEYSAVAPNGKPVGTRGVKWARSQPIEPDAKALSLLVKTAMGRGWREVEQAVNVVQHFRLKGSQHEDTQETKTKSRGRQWDDELAKDIGRACERLLEREWPADTARLYKQLLSASKI